MGTPTLQTPLGRMVGTELASSVSPSRGGSWDSEGTCAGGGAAGSSRRCFWAEWQAGSHRARGVRIPLPLSHGTGDDTVNVQC